VPSPPRTGTVQDRKARAGDLCRTFKVQNSQSLAQINVVFRFEVESSRFAPFAYLDVRRLVLSDRHVRSRNIWQTREKFPHFGIRCVPLLFQFRLGIFQACNFGLLRLGFLQSAGLHHRTDLFAGRITELVDAVGFAYHASALGIQFDKPVQAVDREIPVHKRFANCVKILSYKIKV